MAIGAINFTIQSVKITASHSNGNSKKKVHIILISYAAAPQALKKVHIQVPVETLLSPQSFDLPTHKQTRLKTKVNTHIQTQKNTHRHK